MLGKVVSIVAGARTTRAVGDQRRLTFGIKTGELDNTAGEAPRSKASRASRPTRSRTRAGQAVGGQEPDRHRQGAAGSGVALRWARTGLEYAGSLNQEGGEITGLTAT
ncbi:hypothetical protein WJ968_27130 [Achromobacter xylosoxidans]